MVFLITGVTGQLGHDIAEYLKLNNKAYYAPTHQEMDITSKEEVVRYFYNKKITGIIHCAAYTKVDKAEDEPDLCFKVNVDGTHNIVNMAKEYDIPLIYISTDYVFNGKGDKPWKPDDLPDPINTYGLSKLKGELIVREKLKKFFIIRISWVFGVNGNNFVKTMINLSKDRSSISVVSDQFGSPTYTFDLAPKLCALIETTNYGTYHAHNGGVCSWYHFAKEIFSTLNVNVEVIPIKTDKYPTKAIRPLNSKLDMQLFTEVCGELPSWQDATHRYVHLLCSDNFR